MPKNSQLHALSAAGLAVGLAASLAAPAAAQDEPTANRVEIRVEDAGAPPAS
jgi:hypothetical protein